MNENSLDVLKVTAVLGFLIEVDHTINGGTAIIIFNSQKTFIGINIESVDMTKM